MKVAKFCSVHFVLSHEYVSGHKLSVNHIPVNVFLVPVLLYRAAEKFLGHTLFRFLAQHQHVFPLFQHRIPVGNDDDAHRGLLVPDRIFPYP